MAEKQGAEVGKGSARLGFTGTEAGSSRGPAVVQMSKSRVFSGSRPRGLSGSMMRQQRNTAGGAESLGAEEELATAEVHSP